MKNDIIGIGSPLVDLLCKIDEKQLADTGLQKGGMFLFTNEELDKVFNKFEKSIVKISPGDSTANTIVGAANMGAKTAYIGKVGNDFFGQKFIDSLGNVENKIIKSEFKTGKVIALITPDNERTMIVFLGAARELKPNNINEMDIVNSKILHLTGYQLEDINLKASSIKAMDIAKKNRIKISIDFADPLLITRNKPELIKIAKDYADIIFVNEEEAKAFTGKEPNEALDDISKMCEIAIVKIGSKGSMIKSNGQTFKIAANKVNAMDTTGAGDMFAAGVLFGISQGFNLEKCGKIGAYAASKIVEQIGARLEYSLAEKIKEIN